MIDYKKVSNVYCYVSNDYPDFCDSYIESADYDDEPMSDEMLEELNEDSDFVYESVIKQVF